MITSVVNVVSTIPGLVLVETWGRRNLLQFGAVGMCVCQLIVASVGTALPGSTVASKCLIAFVCIYIFFFACSWVRSLNFHSTSIINTHQGPCAWVVTGESFPLKARARGLSMTTASNWLLNFAIGYATPYMVDSGPGNANLGSKVFFVWGGFCFICCLFVYFCIYETKGLSLEQVDELYAKIPHAWQSTGFVPTVNFTDVADLGANESRRHTLAELETAAVRRKSTATGQTEEVYREKI